MMSGRNGEQIEQRYRELHSEIAGLKAENERLQHELNRANRIAGKADRMYDTIRNAQALGYVLHPRIIGAADAYDDAMSDPQAEATDKPAVCRRCERELDSGHDRG